MTPQKTIRYVARPAGEVEPGDVVMACSGEAHEVTAVEWFENSWGGQEVVLHTAPDADGEEQALVVAADHEVDVVVTEVDLRDPADVPAST
jgi:hypothetical protein